MVFWMRNYRPSTEFTSAYRLYSYICRGFFTANAYKYSRQTCITRTYCLQIVCKKSFLRLPPEAAPPISVWAPSRECQKPCPLQVVPCCGRILHCDGSPLHQTGSPLQCRTAQEWSSPSQRVTKLILDRCNY